MVVVPAARILILSIYLEQASMVSAPELNDELIDHLDSYEDMFVVTNVGSEKFVHEFQSGQKRIIALENVNGGRNILIFNRNISEWTILRYDRENMRSLWASQIYEIMFFLSDSSERESIQSNPHFLHNLVTQSCDLPIGYPAFVSPISTSHYTVF